MLPTTSIVINGVGIHEFKNGYDHWFFRKCDRSIKPSEVDEGVSTDQFIGFRTTAATIRRRMTDAGYKIESCEHYFEQSKNLFISFLEHEIERKLDEHVDQLVGTGGNRNARHYARFYQHYLSVIRDSSLADWIAAFPEAGRLSIGVILKISEEPEFCNISDNPLVNAMLSYVPVNRQERLIGQFNFPGSDWQQFAVAFLASCSDDAICELNIARLINDADIKSFQEYDELLRRETELHCSCRQSVQEIKSLSDSQPGNTSLQRMCYASLITVMEAYLGDILKREIFSRPAVKKCFVKNYEPFKKQKLTFAEIYEKLSDFDAEIKDALDGLSLHKIETAKIIFSNTLKATFPDDQLAFLGAAVQRRHDIVHRNGRDTNGELIPIIHNDVTELALQVELFTRAIDKQILDGLKKDIDAELD